MGARVGAIETIGNCYVGILDFFGGDDNMVRADKVQDAQCTE